MITVYSVETGLPARLHPIDAREQLALRIVTLEPAVLEAPAHEATATKPELVEKAAALGVGAPSQLARWGVEKLKAAIAEAEG